jgi:hypothetical protein
MISAAEQWREQVNRFLMVLALAALLSGCVNAQRDVEITAASTPKYKACPVNSVELEHHGGYIGPFAFDGSLTAEAQDARAARQAAESSPVIPCPVFAERPRPQTIVIDGGRPPLCQWMNGMGSCI